MDERVKNSCPNCCQQYSVKTLPLELESNLPLFIKCGHSMCESCVRKIVKLGKSFECQICLRTMEIKVADIARVLQNKIQLYNLFPVNLSALGELTLQLITEKSEREKNKEENKEDFIDLQAVLDSTDTDQTQGQCLECHRETTKMCQQCATIICEDCFNKSHKNFIVFKNHVLQNIELQMTTNSCKVHCQKPLEYFCKDCAKSICMDCLMVGSEKSCKNHDVVSTLEMNEIFLAQLREILPQVDITFRRLTKTAVDIGHLLKNMGQNSDSPELDQVTATINQHFSKLYAMVQNHKQEVMNNVARLRAIEQESLLRAREEVVSSIRDSAKVITALKSALDSDKNRPANLVTLLEEAKNIVNIPWSLAKDESNKDTLKCAVPLSPSLAPRERAMGVLGVLGAPGVRRAPAVALLALAALLLLLLARLPPSAPARRPPPAPRPEAAHPANRTAAPAHHAANTTAHQAPASEPQPPPPPPPPPPPAKGTKKATAGKEKKGEAEGPLPPGAVLTRDLYVAGHARPHPELCPALGARLRLVILVSSAPSHASAREAVRLTWGHAAQRADVALGFVLGASPPQFRAALDREDALYGDLIEGRSVDSYSNLTLKTLSMLEWVDTYCPRAPRLLKTDDDMFINVNRLLQFAEAPGRRNATGTVWGKVARRSRPARAPRSKYFVPPAQFPGGVFPDFATGPAYLLTADAARRLLRAAPAARYLRLEDVFVTGVLAARLGIRRVHAPEFYNKKVAPHPCAVQRGVAIHMVRYHEQFDLWRKLLDGKTKCAS